MRTGAMDKVCRRCLPGEAVYRRLNVLLVDEDGVMS